MTLALATYRDAPRRPQAQEELDLVLARLRAAGQAAEAHPWDADVDWASFAGVVVRSTWDYFRRFEEFLGWLDRLEHARVRGWNPVRVLKWNADKRYLVELAARGAEVVPTRWLERGARFDLASLLAAEGWEEAVVKPAVSAGAFETFRVTWAEAAGAQARAAALVAAGAVLVQPFLPEITAGELSLHYFGGRPSHAVRKRPCGGDFRVQPQFGGSVELVEPAASVRAAAERILAAVPAAEPLLYARVDGVLRAGRFLLMELELIEPYLFLGADAAAADRYVAAILARLGEGV